jgi:hypothetical protein
LKWRKLYIGKESAATDEYRKRLLDTWYGILEDYTHRQLSFQSDTIPALYGMIEKLQPSISATFIGGFWDSDLWGLMWFRREFKDFRPNYLKQDGTLKNATSKEPQLFKAPSWRWCSTDGSIQFVTIKSSSKWTRTAEGAWISKRKFDIAPLQRRRCIITAKLIQHKVSYNAHGEVEKGSLITLKSHLASPGSSYVTSLDQISLDRSDVSGVAFPDRTIRRNVYDIYDKDGYHAEDRHFYMGEELKFLILGHMDHAGKQLYFGIVVLPSITQPGKFSQVGVFRTFRSYTEVEAVDITII